MVYLMLNPKWIFTLTAVALSLFASLPAVDIIYENDRFGHGVAPNRDDYEDPFRERDRQEQEREDSRDQRSGRRGQKDMEFFELKGPQAGVSTRVNLTGRYPYLQWMNIDVPQKRLQVRLSGHYPALQDLDINNNRGVIKANLSGKFPALSEVAISSQAGNIEVDLNGRWGANCNVTITSTSGNIRVRVPRNTEVGVILTTVTSGEVRSKGLRHASGWKRERRYYSASHQTAPVLLNIKINSTTGDIHLN